MIYLQLTNNSVSCGIAPANTDLQPIDRWKTRLQALTELVLPTDYARPVSNKTVEAEHVLDLPEETALAILKLSLGIRPDAPHLGLSVSPFTILLSAFAILLHKYTGEDDLTVGSSSLSSNPLVLRLNVAETLTMAQVVKHVLQVVPIGFIY